MSRRIDNTLESLLRESLRRPRARRHAVQVPRPVERGMFAGERVSLPGDEVVRIEVRVAVAQHRRQCEHMPAAEIRASARGAIRIAQLYLGASREVVEEALEEIARLT